MGADTLGKGGTDVSFLPASYQLAWEEPNTAYRHNVPEMVD